jgi:LPXTG-motif cell wall-anchored protein
MSKRAMLFLAVLVAISNVYDFHRGYRETRSGISGIVYVIFGLIVLAFFWWLYSKRRNSN